MLEACFLEGLFAKPGCISGVGSGSHEMAQGGPEDPKHAPPSLNPAWGIGAGFAGSRKLQGREQGRKGSEPGCHLERCGREG